MSEESEAQVFSPAGFLRGIESAITVTQGARCNCDAVCTCPDEPFNVIETSEPIDILALLTEIKQSLNEVKQLIPRVDAIGQQQQWIVEQVQQASQVMRSMGNPLQMFRGMKKMGGE